MSNGLIDKAYFSGTADPAMYHRKYPAILRKEKGGYEIQSTPQEVAAVITQSRAWVRGHRMLCVGTETLGAERFIAENLGMMDVEYIGSALDVNAGELKAKQVEAPSGTYDLITVFGTAKVDALLPFTKIGSLLVFLGVGPASKNTVLRQAWLNIRRKHMTMLQTGGEAWQTGVGVVKILFVSGQDTVQPEVKDAEDKPIETQDSQDVTDGEETASPDVQSAKDDGVRVKAEDAADILAVRPDIQPKRRGRQPGSKNKVRA